MKKFLLALLCIASILALPGCWCCRKSCEEPCEQYCDYDDCDDSCDYNDCDDCDDSCDSNHKEGYYRGRGQRSYNNSQNTVVVKPAPAPRKKIMHKPINPKLMRAVEDSGGTIKYCDTRFEKHNDEMVKQEELRQEQLAQANTPSKMRNNRNNEMPEMEDMNRTE